MQGLLPYKVNTDKQVKARTFHVCEICGCDIIPGDYCYQYKPLPIFDARLGKHVAQAWQYRCLDHQPRYYETNGFQLVKPL